MNRRFFLQRLGITAALAGTGSVSVALSAQKPTRAQLERYYTLLWCEHQRLAEEMGVDMFDCTIVHKDGNYEATKLDGPPSSRASGVLTAAGVA